MRNLLSTLLLGTSLFACTSNSDTGDTGDTGDTAQADSAAAVVDSADTTSAEGNLLMATIDGSGAASSDSGLAASGKLQANIAVQFTPSGCAKVTPGASSLKVDFHDCNGPRGLTHITGELELTASVSLQGALTIKGTSTGLEINGATLDVDATGTYAASGTGHTLTVSTSGSGVGPRGNTIQHDGDYTIGWDPATQCRTLDGAWSTAVGAADRSSTVELSQCGAGCPTGSIAHTTVDGKTMTVTFDGTATATWQLTADATGSAGGASGSASVLSSGSLTLDCK